MQPWLLFFPYMVVGSWTLNQNKQQSTSYLEVIINLVPILRGEISSSCWWFFFSQSTALWRQTFNALLTELGQVRVVSFLPRS